VNSGGHGPKVGVAWGVVQRAVHDDETPGAVALVRWHGRTVLHLAAGWAALLPEQRAMKADTIFDLASLTKPLVTAPLVLQLVDRGTVSLDDPVCRYLPSLVRFADGGVTIRQLLTHTSGLPAWSPLYVWARTRPEVLETIAEMELAYEPGSQVIYSCLGYIVLGVLLEEVTRRPLDELACQSLFEPLGLADTGYGPRIDRERCAWTEHGNTYEQANVAASGLTFDGWREDYNVGTVHDGNAWYAMHGVSGNAGLFGTAHDVATLGQMWLDRGRVGRARLLEEQTATAAVLNCTPGLNEARGLGWQINRPAQDHTELAAPGPSSAGEQLSARAFGHTGFTGTSIWVDPARNLVAVLLTNRVHPTVGDSAAIIRLRRRFHDAVAAALPDSPPNSPA